MKNFIEANEVKCNLGEYVVIDCRFDLVDLDYGFKAYITSHIKNSHFLSLERDLSSEKLNHGGRHPLPNMNIFAAKLENIGISNDSRILLYDDDLSVATRLWWMLKYMGINNVKILNGGINAAIDSDIEMEKGQSTYKPASLGKIDIKLNQNLLVTIQELIEMLKNKKYDYILIDSRAPERYKGITEPYDKIAGRIPTAINIFFKEVIDEKKIKPISDLKDIYKNIDTSKKIIAYCGSGVTAPINIIAMDEIGINSRLYLGSYSDYVSYEDNVVDKD